MSKIRVLIVDDAVVVRRLLTEILSGDPSLEVVGVAANGRIALTKIAQLNPDLVILDVEMPEMDGLQALEAIRKTDPRLPVIMFSTHTERGAAATLDALALGANDYVTKPAHMGSRMAAQQSIQDELIPKIKLFCPRRGEAEKLSLAAEAPVAVKTWSAAPARARGKPVEIVALGVSTGGPNALAELVPSFPADLSVPVVIVQHMPPLFTRLLAERLAAKSAIGVSEGTLGEVLRPGHAYVAPGDYHMAVAKETGASRLRLHQGPPENACRPAVDVLFRSVAETYGAGALAVVLTGMGKDGLQGCEAIREAGGQVLVQDEATSVVWGMAGHVARAGLADQVLPLKQIAPRIVQLVKRGGAPPLPGRNPG